jgi:hypothetical protein
MDVRKTLLTMAVVTVVTLAGAPVLAQAPESGPAPSAQAGAAEPVDEVIVRGRRMSEIEYDALRLVVKDFIDRVAAPAPGRGFARWHRGVCVGVDNLVADAAQYVVDRISRLALDLGIEPGEPGCQPDVLVIFSTDIRRLTTYMVEERPLVFRPEGGQGGVQLGLDALKEFTECAREVCWWHVSLPVEVRGGTPAITSRQTPGRGTGGTGFGVGGTAPVVAVDGPSRVRSGIRDDLQSVIVVVDATKLKGTTWQQIGDYLAVVALAQIDPQADLSAYDSILNLFSNPAAYSGLTDWDRSYMYALYRFNQERMPQYQEQGLIDQMARRERDGE